MSAATVKIWVVGWDGDIIEDVCSRLSACGRKAGRGRAVSLLTGAFASSVFCGPGACALPGHEDGGKPFLPGFPAATLSISHTRDIAAVSFSDIPHGIDIESPRPINERMFRRVFTPEETAACSALGREQRTDCFIRAWTRKEALIKTGALTLGEMYRVSAADDTLFYNDNVYYFATFSPGPDAQGIPEGCTLSVCSRGARADNVISRADRAAMLRASALLDRLYFDKH